MANRDELLKRAKLIRDARAKRDSMKEKEYSADDAKEWLKKSKEDYKPTWGDVAQGAAVGVGQGATFGFGDEIYGGAKSLVTDQPYTEARDDARAVIRESRDKVPGVTFAGEMIGGGAVGGGGASFLKSVGQGALYGAGEADEMSDVPFNAAVGGGLSGVIHGVTALAKMPFQKTDVTRAKNLGATSKDFEKVGRLGDPVQMAKELEEAGLFKYKNARLDPESGKFIARNKGTLLSNENRGVPSREQTLRIAKSGIKTASNQKKNIIEKANKKIDIDALSGNVQTKLSELRKNSPNKELFDSEATKTMDSLLDDLYYDGNLSKYRSAENKIAELSERKYPVDLLEQELSEFYSKITAKGRAPTASEIKKMMSMKSNIKNEKEVLSKTIPSLKKEMEKIVKNAKGRDTIDKLEKAKQKWQNKAQSSFESSKINPEFKESAEIQKTLSTALKESIEDEIFNTLGARVGSKFKDLNRMSQNLHQAEKGLVPRIASDAVVGDGTAKAVNPYASPLLQAAKVTEALGGGEKGQLLRARTGDIMSEVMDIPGMGQLGEQMKLAPAREMTQPSRNERKPQSIPEQLIRAKIPRNSQEVMNDPEFIKAKVAQQAPMLFDQVQDVLDNNPESIKDVMLLLSQQAPHLFENDKYGRIDGKIVDPNKKQMAREDVMLNDEMSNSQKMIIINQLNKTGDFPL